MNDHPGSRIETLLLVLCVTAVALVTVVIATRTQDIVSSTAPSAGLAQVIYATPLPAGQTARDTTAPTITIDSPVSGQVSGSVNVSATVSDPDVAGQTTSGIASVQFTVDGVDLGSPLTSGPYNGLWNTLGVTNGNHSLIARAYDNAGNAKTSNTVTVFINNTLSLRPDTVPPTPPSALAASAVSPTQVNLSWQASTDPTVPGSVTSGVNGYKIYRNGIQTATVSGTSYSDTTAAPSVTYIYSVAAYDATSPSNTGLRASPVTIITPAVPTNAAPVITNTVAWPALPVGTTQATIRVVTDVPAVCKYSTVPNTPYIYVTNRFTSSGNTLHSTTVSGLEDGQTYTYYIKCETSAGVANAGDYIISFMVSALIPTSGISSTQVAAPAPTPYVAPVGVLAQPLYTPTSGATTTATTTIKTGTAASQNSSISRLSKGFQFPTPLSVGTDSSYVRYLQIFLNDHGYAVSLSGAGSFGNETTHFGPGTVAAIAIFQTRNGVSPSIGNFGPLTLATVNQLLLSGK